MMTLEAGTSAWMIAVLSLLRFKAMGHRDRYLDLGHRDRYLDSLFRVDEPVRVPRGAYLYIKGWLPSI